MSLPPFRPHHLAGVALVAAGLAIPVFGATWANADDASAVAPAAPTRIVDIRGREVTLPGGDPRIVIDDGRYLLALSLLLDDPTEVLVGWPRDINRIGEGVYQRYVERFPAIDALPRVASSAGAFSLEQTLAVEPTIAVFSLGRGPSDAQVAQLEELGVVPVFLDFFMDPLGHVDRSLELLGQIVGAEAEAERFVQFRAERRARVIERVAALDGARPEVFLEAHAGRTAECCNSAGSGNVGVYIELAGGHNIAADVLPGPVGRVQFEYVLDRNPAVYIATGGPHLAGTGGLVLGSGYASAEAGEALRRTVARPGFEYLNAVMGGRAHGLSHQLLNSPLDIVALEAIAGWIHPEVFGDVDPGETLRRINTDFLAVSSQGTYWVSLDQSTGDPSPSPQLP